MKTIVEIADGVRRGKIKARAAVQTALDTIEARNGPLNAFVMMDAEGALKAADAIDARVAAGEDPGPLAGVPYGVKDMEDTIGFRSVQGSVFLKDSPIKTADNPHIARLRAAGAIVVGKTAMSEFGMDSATHTRLFGTTRNPWNPATTPGGSSGGSSAAVAAGMVPFATGTDAGGSIREPAAFTNLVGLKPSHGRIAKTNGFSNFATHGALTRTVADTARYLDVAAGPNDSDRQSLPALDYKYEDVIETLDIGGLRAVWSDDTGYAVVEPEVVAIARAAAEKLIAAAKLNELKQDVRFTFIGTAWAIVMMTNLEADWTRDGILPDGFDQLAPNTQYILGRMRERGPDQDVKSAWAQIHRLEQEVATFFRGADLLMTPATGCRPYQADSTLPRVIDGRDCTMSGGVEPFGMVANACWNPSISIPAGFTADGLPVGLQVTARRHRDDILLRLARIHELSSPWTFPWD
ncbi:Acylamidase [Alphaproteobacteria bacterium SO-S41]|nr:Acylamidase [Alphaproteobacteria bacterium SO-S41]